jgi:hypothetical protein
MQFRRKFMHFEILTLPKQMLMQFIYIHIYVIPTVAVHSQVSYKCYLSLLNWRDSLVILLYLDAQTGSSEMACIVFESKKICCYHFKRILIFGWINRTLSATSIPSGVFSNLPALQTV